MDITFTLQWGDDKLTISDLDKEGDVEINLEKKHEKSLNTYLVREDIYALRDHLDYLVQKLNSEASPFRG